jgi:hypothetical protein
LLLVVVEVHVLKPCAFSVNHSPHHASESFTHELFEAVALSVINRELNILSLFLSITIPNTTFNTQYHNQQSGSIMSLHPLKPRAPREKGYSALIIPFLNSRELSSAYGVLSAVRICQAVL